MRIPSAICAGLARGFCILGSKTCPVDEIDPHIFKFLVHNQKPTDSAKQYHFLIGIRRSIS